MWIRVDERLPPLGVSVYVRGQYTPDAYPNPRASRQEGERARAFGPWSSNEWRGMVAITEWWDEEGETECRRDS